MRLFFDAASRELFANDGQTVSADIFFFNKNARAYKISRPERESVCGVCPSMAGSIYLPAAYPRIN
jgi:sucrose-6-phosphate hydrolase SacC (GH32 family)